ncbi:hypothetical protein Tco_1357844, partial [Tanacetum coccineum]
VLRVYAKIGGFVNFVLSNNFGQVTLLLQVDKLALAVQEMLSAARIIMDTQKQSLFQTTSSMQERLRKNLTIAFSRAGRVLDSQEEYWGVARHHHKGRWEA